MEPTMYKATREQNWAYCSKCRKYAKHKFRNCPRVECRKCKDFGHIEIDCPDKHIREKCSCRKKWKINLTCPIHIKKCLCFNRAASYCGIHNHEILWDEYGVCENCLGNVKQHKED